MCSAFLKILGRLNLCFCLVHASRDKILLDDNRYPEGDDGDDDEVFALKGLERDEDDEEEEDFGDSEEEEYKGEDENDTDLTPGTTSKSKKKAKKQKKGKRKNSDDEEEEEEETWGRGKAAYYSSNAAQLESDDEEGHELEEQEAKRLQKKALEGMNDDDFGLKDKHEISRTEDPLECVNAFLMPRPCTHKC